jgi:cysteine desulfurase
VSQRPRIYLDHAATTPVLPAAKAAMAEAMERWANPSSPHAEGRAARAALEDARERIKRALGWDGELIFTSGATEAIDIAIGRAKADRQLLSAVEHEAVFRAAPGAAVLPLIDGEPDLDALTDHLRRPGRVLVALQQINSETGTSLIFNVRPQTAELVGEAGGILLSDCAQSAGKTQLPSADLIVISSHKFGGPPGIGALLVRDLALIEAAGGQELGYRAGTVNVPAALGFAAALETSSLEDWPTTAEQRFGFKDALFQHGEVISPGVQCSHIFAVAMPDLSARAQLIQFDLRGFAVSVGSACSSGSLKPSRALQAFGIPADVAERTIRVSIGWNTTSEELDAFASAYEEVAADARKRAA